MDPRSNEILPSDERLARLRSALQMAGLPRTSTLTLATSNANEVWLGEDFVLRVNYRGDIGRLAREASIVAHLPPEVCYPELLGCGQGEGIEWICARRVAGVPLSSAWPAMSAKQRRSAIVSLAETLRALHSIDAPTLPGDRDLDGPHILPLDRIESQIASLRGVLDTELLDALSEKTRSLWPAFDDNNRGLVHGDLHMENVLWHEGRVTALLDLEWARLSWCEVDLETMLAFCAFPAWFVAEAQERTAHPSDWAQVPGWFEMVYPEWFSHPRRDDRLTVLAITYHLGHYVDEPPRRPQDPADPRDRRNHLQRLAR